MSGPFFCASSRGPAATEKAKSLGAEIIKANVEVGEMGKFSIINDPTGATIGLWQEQRR